jgi:hypothetical protein
MLPVPFPAVLLEVAVEVAVLGPEKSDVLAMNCTSKLHIRFWRHILVRSWRMSNIPVAKNISAFNQLKI